MARSIRRFTFAAIALPFLFLVMAGMARANSIFVNATDGDSDPAPLCTLPDAITAHNSQTAVNGCGAGNGLDTIYIGVTGTILIDETLEITNGIVTIQGPTAGGPAGPSPAAGITIDGGSTVQIIRADVGTSVLLNALTLADGLGTTVAVNTGGGAVSTTGFDLEVNDCLFLNNKAEGSSSAIGGEGGAIYAGVSGKLIIVNSTFANNTAVHGSSTNSIGGAIRVYGDNMKVTNSTFSGNSADSAGGIDFYAGVTTLKNTILANNTGGNCNYHPTDLGANISDDASCGFSVSPSMNSTDPLLEPLANNGGPTDTFALETSPSTSPAIDLVTIAQCTDQASPTPQPLGIDQRLFARPDPANLNACDSGAYEADALAPFTLNSERVQIARSSSPNLDQVNIGITFTENGDPDCDLGVNGDEDALNDGINVSLFQGTCADIPANGLTVFLDTFVVHTVNHQQYGTLFQSSPTVPSPETVSARMVALPPPPNACSAYTLNLEVAGLNTRSSKVNLGGTNPFALVLTDPNGDGAGCFDITNAIVGNQIPTPSHMVRRGVRRQTRR